MTIDLYTERPAALVDDECGHVTVTVADENQHHEIPDDDAPHVPTDQRGRGPQRHTVGGHIVYEHVDQDLY